MSPDPSRTFFSVAVDLSMLSAEAAREIADEAGTSGVSPAELALRKGLLDPVQTDIVETLLNRRDTIPGYEIIDVLGYGGMGVVYRARQKNLDRIVALKTVLVSRMSDMSALSRFEQEALAIGRLQHAHIVAAYDFGRSAGRLYLAMELIEGDNLAQLIEKRGRLDEFTAWTLARQAVAGLAHASRLGIVHRDIKPENLLLIDPKSDLGLSSQTPALKITDFGLAFLTKESDARTRITATNSAIGTPHYMAPEQISGERVDFRADIYALGATVFHALVGVPPFDGKSLAQIVAKKLRAPAPVARDAFAGISRESSELIAEMMSPELEKRIADYTALAFRIDRVLEQVVPRASAERRPLRSTSLTETVMVTADPSQLEASPRQEPKSRPARGSRIPRATAIGAIVLAAAAVLALCLFPLFTENRKGDALRSEMVTSGWGEHLFDGQTLRGWNTRSGAWAPATDEDGALVLAGTNGVCHRGLFRTTDSIRTPLAHYRLMLAVRLHEAKEAELHIGIADDKQPESPRYVVHITPNEITLGQRRGNHGRFQALSKPFPFESSNDSEHELRVEQEQTRWRVFCDERFLGKLPITAAPALPEFRLVVEAGPAWFSDIEVEELKLPSRGQ